MSNYLSKIGKIFSTEAGRGGGINIKKIRPRMLIYSLAYTFELMLYAVWESFLVVDVKVLGLPGKTVIYVGHMIGSLIVMLLWSERFRRLIRISVAVMGVGFVPFVLVQDGTLRLAFGIIAMAGLGGAVTCARCGYAFAANNAERLTGISLMTVAVAGVYLLDAFDLRGPAVTVILPLLLAAALSGCLLCFREEDLHAKKEYSKSDARGLYWALAFMIGYFGIDGYLYHICDETDRKAYVVFIAGIVAAAAILFIALAKLRLNVWHLWTLFFALAVTAGTLTVISPQLGSALPHHLFCGLSILGWPLSLYMLACAQRRYASYKLLKRCTVIFVILSPITTISDEITAAYIPSALPVVALVYIVVMLFLFLLTLPFSYKDLFSSSWLDGLRMEDMALIGEKVEAADRFSGYGLTPRQKEVATLLLAARTRRQISGELGLSESTVKTHTSELYKKLGINSRVELFKLFGVAEVDADNE